MSGESTESGAVCWLKTSLNAKDFSHNNEHDGFIWLV